MKIPYGKQSIDESDILEVAFSLRGEWLTTGPAVDEFERTVAAFTGSKFAVAFNSGTSALHGAMFAAGVSIGDEIITSPMTFCATSNSALYLGAKPVFVDIDPKTYCIDLTKIYEKITKKTKVIVPVDYSGFPADISGILEIAKEKGLIVIEDAAHALGSERNGDKTGSISHMTMFSFHPVKHITTGEGGMITTDSEEYYNKMKIFRTHGITKEPDKMEKNDGPWYYEMQDLGYNYRITDFQCALGISQMKKIDRFLERRIKIADYYDSIFKEKNLLQIPPRPENGKHAFHLYPLLLDRALNKLTFYSEMAENGIFCQVHYVPVHFHPYYRKNFGFLEGDFPVAEDFYRREISIPMYPAMTDEEVNYVADTVLKLLKNTGG